MSSYVRFALLASFFLAACASPTVVQRSLAPPPSVSPRLTLPPLPTATLTPFPTEIPLSTLTPTPDLLKYQPKDFSDCCAKDVPYAKAQAERLMKEYLAKHNVKEDLDKAKSLYSKPIFFNEADYGPEGTFGDTNIGLVIDALYIGSFELDLQNMNFGLERSVPIHVTMGVYLPVDSPDAEKTLIAIKQLSYDYNKNGPLAGKRVVKGVNFLLTHVMKDGKVALGSVPEDQKEQQGQVVRLYEYIAMAEVGMYSRGEQGQKGSPKYNPQSALEGQSLTTQLGISAPEDLAKELSASLNAGKDINQLLKAKLDGMRFVLLHKIVLKSIPGVTY